MKRILAIIAAVSLTAQGSAFAQSPAESVLIGNFSGGSLKGWEQKIFKGETKYSFVVDAETNATALKAEANSSASGMFRKHKVDLSITPFLNWSWKVNDTFQGINEDVKGGDDFPARIYVVVERGLLGTSSLSLNYVWASQHPAMSLWPSPFTKQVHLLAMDSGAKSLGKWAHHKRDLRVDLAKAFGEEISVIDAVALMTDTDNSGRNATTLYGNIWLSAE